MKNLLLVTVVVELGTGVGLAVVPSVVTSILLGAPLDSPVGLVISRVLGAALVTIASVCWIARSDVRSRTAVGLVAAMLFYNFAAVVLLGYARFGLGMAGLALVPAVILHIVLAAWCVRCLAATRSEV